MSAARRRGRDLANPALAEHQLFDVLIDATYCKAWIKLPGAVPNHLRHGDSAYYVNARSTTVASATRQRQRQTSSGPSSSMTYATVVGAVFSWTFQMITTARLLPSAPPAEHRGPLHEQVTGEVRPPKVAGS